MSGFLRPGHLFCAITFLAPLVAVFTPPGMVPLVALLIIGCLLLEPRRSFHAGWPRWLIIAMVALPAWAALTALWAINPKAALSSAVKLAGLVAGAWVLTAQARAVEPRFQRPLMLSLLAGASLSWGLLLALAWGLDLLTPLFTLAEPQTSPKVVLLFARAFTVLGLLSPVIVFSAWRLGGWWLAAVMAGLSVAAALATHSLGVKIGLAAMIVVYLANWRWPRMSALALVVGLVGLIAAAPLIPKTFPPPQVSWETMRWIPFSAHHRMTIWQFTAERITEKPVSGWGMDAARDIPGGEDRVLMVRDDARIPEQMMPLHPHNALLQIWLELGLIGAVITAMAVAAMILSIGRWSSPPCRNGAMATFAAAMVTAMVSFGAWQSWWLCSLILATALWPALAPRTPHIQAAA